MTGTSILSMVNHEDESKANIAQYAPINITINVKQHFESVLIVSIILIVYVAKTLFTQEETNPTKNPRHWMPGSFLRGLLS